MPPYLHKPTDLPHQAVFPGITGHLVHTDRTTIGDFTIAAGTELPTHHHPHEQVSTVLSGRFEFTVGGAVRECGPGDVAVIGPDVPHSGRALTDCRIIDVFTPVREDYRAETERLLAERAAPEPDYRPIDCGVYDHFEAAIVQRRPVELVYVDNAGNESRETLRLTDLKTEDKVEYVRLADGRWLRLDRVRSIGGVVNGACAVPARF